MDSCYRNNVSLGYNTSGRIHFCPSKREQKTHWTRDSSSSQNSNMYITTDNSAYCKEEKKALPR